MAARRALQRASLLAGQASRESEDIGWSGQVRRDLRVMVEDMPDSLTREDRPVGLAEWLTAPWPDLAAVEANAWLSARTWDEREAALRAAAHLTTSQGRHDLQMLCMLHPDMATAIGGLESVLDAIRDSGIEVALADLAPSAQRADLVAAWLATPTWDESQHLLAVHPELLYDHRTDDILRAFATGYDGSAAAASQHLAILALCRHNTVDEAYEIVTDLDAASEAAWDAITQADGNLLMVILAAAPHLLGHAFLAPALASCALLLQPHDNLDECAALMKQAAEQGSNTQRQAITGRLRRLLRHRPDLRTDIDMLIAMLTST